MSANNLQELSIPQSFADVIVKTPLTMTLLIIVSTLAIMFGLHSVDDRAMMLASGASVPIRVTLWQVEQSASSKLGDNTHVATMNLLAYLPFASSSELKEKATVKQENVLESDFTKVDITSENRNTDVNANNLVEDEAKYSNTVYKEQEKRQKAFQFAWMIVMCAIRFTLASVLITTSGELLITFAALLFITRPLEKLVKTRRCVWLLVLFFLFHALYFILIFFSFAHWRTINYRMQPGLSWLNVSFYIVYERLESSLFSYNSNRSGNNVNNNNNNNNDATIGRSNVTAQATSAVTTSTSSRFSRLRLYGKIPIGPETVRAVIFIHLLFRGDVLMSTIPACLVGLLFPISYLHGRTNQEEVSLLNSN